MTAKETPSPPGAFTRDTGVRMSPPQMRASLLAAAVLFIAGVWTLHEFLPSLVWALVFAIAVWPLFERGARRWPQHKRGLLPALVVVGVVMIFVAPVTIAAVPLARDAHGMAAWVQEARTHGIPAPPLLSRLPYATQLVGWWQANLGQPGQLSELASRTVQGHLLVSGRRIAAEALHRVVLLGFMLVALFFLLRQAESVVEQVKTASRRAFGPAGESVGRQLILSVHGTVNGLVLVGLVQGMILGVAYVIAGLPHATLFGLMTALLAMIPFGAFVALAVAGVVLLAVNKIVAAILVVAVGSVVIFVGDHFFRPVLIGGATRLPFVWVLLAILGGVTAWGLVGLFAGPAIMAALMLLWREWIGSQKGPLNPLPQDVDV